MNWIELVQNVGLFSVAIAALVFIAKRAIEKFLEGSLEKYKSDLERETETHKHQLQIITEEHQIRYTKLHADRAEVIKTLYEKLVLMENSMRDYMSPIQLGGLSKDEKKEKASNSAQGFFDLFFSNEIFFDEKICGLIKEMNKVFFEAWNEYTVFDDRASREAAQVDSEFRRARVDAWIKAWEKIDQKIPPLKEELKSLFRKLLGVN